MLMYSFVSVLQCLIASVLSFLPYSLRHEITLLHLPLTSHT